MELFEVTKSLQSQVPKVKSKILFATKAMKKHASVADCRSRASNLGEQISIPTISYKANLVNIDELTCQCEFLRICMYIVYYKINK